MALHPVSQRDYLYHSALSGVPYYKEMHLTTTMATNQRLVKEGEHEKSGARTLPRQVKNSPLFTASTQCRVPRHSALCSAMRY